jgi:hypothetical protein
MDLLTMEMKVLSSGILITNCEYLTSCKVGISMEGPSMYHTHRLAHFGKKIICL